MWACSVAIDAVHAGARALKTSRLSLVRLALIALRCAWCRVVLPSSPCVVVVFVRPLFPVVVLFPLSSPTRRRPAMRASMTPRHASSRASMASSQHPMGLMSPTSLASFPYGATGTPARSATLRSTGLFSPLAASMAGHRSGDFTDLNSSFNDAAAAASMASGSNSVSRLEESILVHVRLRPTVEGHQSEAARNGDCVSTDASGKSVTLSAAVTRSSETKRMQFDHVFPQTATQEELAAEVNPRFVRACLQGYNGTICQKQGQTREKQEPETQKGTKRISPVTLDWVVCAVQSRMDRRAVGQSPRAVSCGPRAPAVCPVLICCVCCVPVLLRKTFTMTGSLDADSPQRGLIPRLLKSLFSDMEKRESDLSQERVTFSVVAEFVEIYNGSWPFVLHLARGSLPRSLLRSCSPICLVAAAVCVCVCVRAVPLVRPENLRDLLLSPLEKPMPLDIRTLPTLHVNNLTRHELKSYDDAMRKLDTGNKARTFGITKMNDNSSRSHSVFTLYITTKYSDNRATTSKLNLVDRQPRTAHSEPGCCILSLCSYRSSCCYPLSFAFVCLIVSVAGSENQKSAGTSGDRLKEGANINKSLSILSQVISALSQKKGHIPFRNRSETQHTKISKQRRARIVSHSFGCLLFCVGSQQTDVPAVRLYRRQLQDHSDRDCVSVD